MSPVLSAAEAKDLIRQHAEPLKAVGIIPMNSGPL